MTTEQFHDAAKLPFVVVLDDVRSMLNVGSIFRTADAFRLAAVYLCGITATPPSAEIHKTALGAEESVSWQYFVTAEEAVTRLRDMGYSVFSIEQAEGSTMLNQMFAHSPDDKKSATAPIAIVLGNEVKGVKQSVIDLSDGCIEIPQYGTKHSMNVAVAAGIVMWEIANHLRQDR